MSIITITSMDVLELLEHHEGPRVCRGRDSGSRENIVL